MIAVRSNRNKFGGVLVAVIAVFFLRVCIGDVFSGVENGSYNRNMVRLKLPVTPTKQRIGVGFNRNKTEGCVVLFFGLARSFLGREDAFWWIAVRRPRLEVFGCGAGRSKWMARSAPLQRRI
jgi:hypothetical protein